MPNNEVKPSRSRSTLWIVMAVATAFGAVLGFTGAGPSNMQTIMYWAAVAGLTILLICIYIGRRREK